MPPCKNPNCEYQAKRDEQCWDFCCEKCEGRYNGEEWASKGRKRHTAYCTSNDDGFQGGGNDQSSAALDDDGRASKKRRGRPQPGGDLFEHPPLLDPSQYGASWPGGGPGPAPGFLGLGGDVQAFGTDGMDLPPPPMMPPGMPPPPLPPPPGMPDSGMLEPPLPPPASAPPSATDEADPIARMERAILRSLSASETIAEVGKIPEDVPAAPALGLDSIVEVPPPGTGLEAVRGQGDRSEGTGMGEGAGKARLWRPPPPGSTPRPALPGIPGEGSSGSMPPAAHASQVPAAPVSEARVPGVPRVWRPPARAGAAPIMAAASSSEPVLSGIPPALRANRAIAVPTMMAAGASPISGASGQTKEVAHKTDKLANTLRDKLMANRKKASADKPEVPAGDFKSRIAALEQRKKAAISVEDFDEAKRLKLEIKDLQAQEKEASSRIAELEHEKNAAIAMEDFDRAKQLKLEIEEAKLAEKSGRADNEPLEKELSPQEVMLSNARHAIESSRALNASKADDGDDRD